MLRGSPALADITVLRILTKSINLLIQEEPLLRQICLLVCCLVPVPGLAGYFNCSVVYDEFESLMNKQFLTEPDRFVSTVNQRLSRSEFEQLQRGQFQLYEERADMGIAIFRTSENLSGKMLYRWSEPLTDGHYHLVIEQVVLYGSVEYGYGARRSGPYRIKPGYGLDLDTGQYDNKFDQTAPDTKAFTIDLKHSVDPESGDSVFEAVNDALIHFPVETMCHQTSQ